MKIVAFLVFFAFVCESIAVVEEQAESSNEDILAKLEQKPRSNMDETFANLEGEPKASDDDDQVDKQSEADDQSAVDNQSVGDSNDGAQLQWKRRNLPRSYKGTCLSRFYVLAFTSKVKHGGSDKSHQVELTIGGVTRRRTLYDRVGDDMLHNKGDLWKMKISDFCSYRCVKLGDIKRVAIVAANNDGWNIDSIVTMVKDVYGKTFILTQNLDVYRWVDGDSYTYYRRFNLSFA